MFAQRTGSLDYPPAQLVLAFSADDLLGLEEKINKYVGNMLVEIDTISMTCTTDFCAIVVFKNQDISN